MMWQRAAKGLGSVILCGAAAGCSVLRSDRATPEAPENPPEIFPQAQRAFFAEFPSDLLTAAERSCGDPGQNLRRPDAATVVCESLPSPEGAAALILTHNGTVEALPSLFTTLATLPLDGGYVVAGDSYISVPQRDGGVVQLRLPETDARIRALLADAGGRPLD